MGTAALKRPVPGTTKVRFAMQGESRTCLFCGKPLIFSSGHPHKIYCDRQCWRDLCKTRLIGRFWSRVHKTRGCWLWTALKNPKGYGLFPVRARERCVLAHRFSWELGKGRIPDGMCVLHHCDVRNCVRPSHLFLGTQTDNLRDMYEKGRHPKGEDRGHAKLTNAQVLEMRARYAAGGIRQKDLAKDYGIVQATVSFIVRHVTWTHLP